MTTVRDGCVVTLRLTGRLANGEVFDSTDGGDPVTVRLGDGTVLAAFERAILGMAVDEQRSFQLPPHEAYGQRDDSRRGTVRRPSGVQLEVGQVVAVEGERGGTAPVVVAGLRGEEVDLDLNHPLRGETLYYDVQVVRIEEPNAAA